MKKGLFRYILAGILLVGIVFLGVYFFNISRMPLGKPLDLKLSDQNGIAPSSAQNEAVVCGQRGAFTVLAVGADVEDIIGLPGSDLTRLVRVDFSHKKSSVFSLPRDLWVDVSRMGFQDPSVTETTLGKAFFLGYERSNQAEEPGKLTDSAQTSAQMILDNFGVVSDHYLVLSLDQLPAVIDAIGGLPIDVPERTTDPWIGTVIEAGPQVLTGLQLRAYARAIPDSESARVQRSDLIIRALRKKLLDPSVWVRLPSLYNMFADKMIVTDLTPQQIFSLFCLLQAVPTEEIAMVGVESGWTSPGPSNSLLWDKDKVTAALKQLDLLH